MQCAKCSGITLVVQDSEGVRVHRCPSCQGLFLPVDALELLAGRISMPALDTDGFTTISDRNDMIVGSCPACRVVMTPVLGPRNMRVDRCPECRGNFLDQGELREVLRR